MLKTIQYLEKVLEEVRQVKQKTIIINKCLKTLDSTIKLARIIYVCDESRSLHKKKENNKKKC